MSDAQMKYVNLFYCGHAQSFRLDERYPKQVEDHLAVQIVRILENDGEVWLSERKIFF